ncbi:MAG: hypothetical protein LBK26_04470 [Rickettsiales bacterium]|jgi:hypothetical protein|nr:hypothetical protein [Rickettsiales bacterium]
MKKQLSLFVWAAAAFGIGAVLNPMPVSAATIIRNNIGYAETGYHGASVADMAGGPARPSTIGVHVNKIADIETGATDDGYGVRDGQNMYYASPGRRADIYRDFDGCDSNCDEPAPAPVQSKRAETAKQKSVRKYHLAHPFFQPTQGRIGSITDIGWSKNSYDFAFQNVVPAQIDFIGQTGNWNATELFIKEDLSFGITDTVAIIGSARYGQNTLEMNWDGPTIPNDKNTNSGFDQWGIGLQWRFYEDADWISSISGYYQWNETANAFLADAKLGYKIANSTIYGLVRAWSVGWKDNSYGNGVTNDAGQVTFFAFKRDIDRSLYLEGGAGLFSALNDDWSVNVELTFGDYDWHSQAGINAGLFYQPLQSFAIGLYGRMSAWDSANGGDKTEAWGWSKTISAEYIGQIKMDSYSDTLVGVKAFLYF